MLVFPVAEGPVRLIEFKIVHLPVAGIDRRDGPVGSADRVRRAQGEAANRDQSQESNQHQMSITLLAMPSASVQKLAEVCISSTTDASARANSSICCSLTMSGGAALSTIKLLPQICVRNSASRNRRITMTWPNIPG